MNIYETIIVGGGPAGLTAAIHLAWHDRKVLVIDRKTGPLFFTLENLYNVPGMPAVRGIELQKQLRKQAESLGAEIVKANVVSAQGAEGAFTLRSEDGKTRTSQTILLATGVARYHPTVDATTPHASLMPAKATCSTARIAKRRKSKTKIPSSLAPARQTGPLAWRSISAATPGDSGFC